MLSGPFLSREAKQINGGWVRGPSVCAAHHANCNAPLLPLASVLDSKGCTGVQLEADRVGIRWAGHGFLLMGTADMLPLSFGAAAGGRWVLSALLKNHQRFALLTDLTCLVLSDLFELLCCSCEIVGVFLNRYLFKISSNRRHIFSSDLIKTSVGIGDCIRRLP